MSPSCASAAVQSGVSQYAVLYRSNQRDGLFQVYAVGELANYLWSGYITVKVEPVIFWYAQKKAQ